MRKLDYFSQDPNSRPPLPPDMEYAYGCFPAMSAAVLANVAIFFSIASYSIAGVSIPVFIGLTGLTAVAWICVVITLRRQNGLFAGIISGMLALVPSVALFLLFRRH